MTQIYSNANRPPRHQIAFTGKGRTKQSMKDECDINKIMAKYQRTGLIAHAQQHGGEYGFADSATFHEAMNVVSKANSMFAELPSTVRERFNGDPAQFLDFVQNPANENEMRSLGILQGDAGAPSPDGDVTPGGASDAPADDDAPTDDPPAGG